MKRFLYASLAVVALSGCQKQSFVDPSLTTSQEIQFAPYAGASTTKGDAVNSNADFQKGSFKVSAFSGTESYFGFNTVSYDDSKWVNGSAMYWPNADASLHFGAYYPTSATFMTDAEPAYSHATGSSALTFGYQVGADVAGHQDIMYAITDHVFEAPATGTNDAPEAALELRFKHALTQIGFTATKDADLNVFVKSLKICNVVDNGTFTATAATTDATLDDDNSNGADDPSGVITTNFGTWALATPTAARYGASAVTAGTNIQNYAAEMVDFESGKTSLEITAEKGAASVNPLTSATEVMMLMPQTLKAWNPTDKTANTTGVESFLAIECKITHKDGEAPIVDGIVYVPFGDVTIPYSTAPATGATDGKDLRAGYKITFNLNFGGGYTIPNDPDDPDKPTIPTVPGEIPNPEDVIPTLRDITYTATVDEWIPVAGGNVAM